MAAEDRNVRGNKIKPDEVDARKVDAKELYENGQSVTGAPDNVEGHTTQGAAGTVPTAQSDGSLSMIEPSGGVWQEDGNSPVSVSESDGAYTYNLASSWDRVLVMCRYDKTSTTARTVDLILNGHTGTDYYSRKVDGATETGGSSLLGALGYCDGNGEAVGTLLIDGRWDTTCSVKCLAAGDTLSAETIQHGHTAAVSSPLSSFTVTNSNGESAEIELNVFGRDL